MAYIHGKNGSFALINAAGNSKNLSADGNSVTLTESVNNPESTGFGDGSVQRSGSGLADVKVTYEGYANDAASANLDCLWDIKGYITLITWGPNGSAGGSVKYTACMLIDDAEVKGAPDGLVTARASFSLASGSITKGTF